MTEEEWEPCRDAQRLVEQLYGRAGLQRKRRLFLCGCFRMQTGNGDRLARFVDIAERFADNCATHEERRLANITLLTGIQSREPIDGQQLVYWATLRDSSYGNLAACLRDFYRPGDDREYILCDLIRDIFGNPFRPVTFDPNWRTSTVVALAQQMYDSRDFAPMPILADALQDAGCEHPDILAHCRGEGPHVRGCWVVDGVLGKA